MASASSTGGLPADDEEAPVSISSLRSKFESLAAGDAGKDAGNGPVGIRRPFAVGKLNPTKTVGLDVESARIENNGSMVNHSTRIIGTS
jgi:hypothetical protein